MKSNYSKNKPLIGLTTFCENKPKKVYSSVSYNYVTSIVRAGGIPVLIPIINSRDDLDYYLEEIDGLLLTGGEDISPMFYGENPIKEVTLISSDRDEQEIELFKKAYEKDMPVLGICRGVQLMNVSMGGTLYQDIHAQKKNVLGHSPMETQVNNLYHSVNIKKETKLYNIFGKEQLFVNSFHHQALKNVPELFSTSALSEDDIIEGIEARHKKFMLGVQWHPEDLTEKYAEFLKLFEAFINACE